MIARFLSVEFKVLTQRNLSHQLAAASVSGGHTLAGRVELTGPEQAMTWRGLCERQRQYLSASLKLSLHYC